MPYVVIRVFARQDAYLQLKRLANDCVAAIPYAMCAHTMLMTRQRTCSPLFKASLHFVPNIEYS